MDEHATLRLTTAIAEGDQQAFAEFYHEYFNEMYKVAKWATRGDESFCLDVVQDAMMKVIRKMKPFPNAAVLDAWLRRIVISTAYDRLRSERRRRVREQKHIDAARSGGDQSSIDDRLDVLRAELAQLDAATEWLLLARYRFEWTLERIGATLGISPGAVDGRLRCTHEQLRSRTRKSSDD